MSVNLAHMAGNTNYEPNGMNCDIHVGYVNIASCRVVSVPRHVACSGRVGGASSVMDDLCPTVLLTLLIWLAVLTTNQIA